MSGVMGLISGQLPEAYLEKAPRNAFNKMLESSEVPRPHGPLSCICAQEYSYSKDKIIVHAKSFQDLCVVCIVYFVCTTMYMFMNQSFKSDWCVSCNQRTATPLFFYITTSVWVSCTEQCCWEVEKNMGQKG